jgi:hypothetical protein
MGPILNNEPPEKALIQSGIRALQLFVYALKDYVKAKYPPPQEKDSQ